MEIFGVRFAQLNIPLDRRLQTLSVLLWILIVVLGNFLCLGLFIFLTFSNKLWSLTVLYLCFIYYDRDTPSKGGRRYGFIKRLPFWKYMSDYFPINLKKTIDLDKNRNYLFCCHPHGLFCAGIFGNFINGYSSFDKLFPGFSIFGATLNLHFSTPFFRDFVMGFGGIASSKDSLKYVLDDANKGNVVILAVGGAAEAFLAKPGSYRIILKNRRGFIKVALDTGCSVVPVFSFGENEITDQVANPPGSLLYKVQQFCKYLTGFAPLIPKGRGIFQYSYGILPLRSPITTVVGEPIDVPKTVNPSKEIIEKYHSTYVEALTKLFEEHKHEYLMEPTKTFLVIH